MDNQRHLLLNWTGFYQDKSMDELKQLVMLTMELEEARLKAQEELKIKEEEISRLKIFLNSAIKERDEAEEKCQKALLEKLLLQKHHQSAPHSGISSIEDDPRRGIDSNNGFSSSDSDESIVSSPQTAAAPPQPPPEAEPELPIVIDRPLPEKGKLLQAVIKAGPLLQTLLLAGPLPQWRHPPPPLDTYQIPAPPVLIPAPPIPTLSQSLSILHESLPNSCGSVNRKRGLPEGYDSTAELKYQRVLFQ